MPLYEYECQACHARFERIQKFSDPPVDTCPTCGGPVTKLPSSPAIQFKGSGWYVTDYARKGGAEGSPKKGEEAPAAKNESAPASSPSTDASSKPEKSSDKKPPAEKT